MPRPYGIALLVLMVTTSTAVKPAQADIYKTVDKDGKVVFSDQPGGNAEPVRIGPTNSMQTPSSAGGSAQTSTAPAEVAPVYQSLDITSPENGGTVTNPGGNVLVHFALSPPLREGDSTRLLVDGTPGGIPAEGGLLAPGTDRGDHIIEVQVLDAAGTVLRASSPVRVTVFRTPVRQKPGRPINH